jgi:predicted permease
LKPIVQKFMDAIGANTYRAFLADGGYAPRVNLMRDDLVGELERPLWILLGTVGALLLIACANVTNLFLVRAEGRQREIAVRGALGASRASLVKLVLAESILVAAVGSALGIGLAAWGVPLLLQLAPPDIPRLDRVTIDGTVVVVAVAVGLLTSLIFGLIPALRYTKAASLGSLRHGGRGGTDDPARRRVRNGLVVLQTSMALVLLVGSGLLARSFTRLMTTDLGFDPQNVITFRVALPSALYSDRNAVEAFDDELLRRLRELPRVESAGAATVLPIAQSSPGTARDFDGRPLGPEQLPPMVHYKNVRLGYFETMRMALLSGRDFHAGDYVEGTRSVIVNRALAEQYWPGEDPIGKRVRTAAAGAPQAPPWFTVVGVVGDERQDGLRRPVRPLMYFTSVSDSVPGGAPRAYDFVVRGPDIVTRAEELRQAVWAIDRGLPVASMRTMDEIVSRSIVEFTFTMLTLAIAAGMALLLGAIGLYGVLSYAVTLRTREIGVRLALGASPGRVMRSVVVNGTLIAAIGLLIGLAGSFGLTRLLDSLLYEIKPFDPPTVAAMSAALLGVAAIASFLPARRAAAVSPTESMKSD